MNEIHTCQTERSGGTNRFPRRRKGGEGVSAQCRAVRWKWAERRRRDGSWLMETSWRASCVFRCRRRQKEGRWNLLTAVIELRPLTSPSRDKRRRRVKGQARSMGVNLCSPFSSTPAVLCRYYWVTGPLLSLQEHKRHCGRCDSCRTISCEQSRWCKANELSLIL